MQGSTRVIVDWDLCSAFMKKGVSLLPLCLESSGSVMQNSNRQRDTHRPL